MNSDSKNSANSVSFVDAENLTVAEIQGDTAIAIFTENYHSSLYYFSDKNFSSDILQQLLL